MLLIKRLFFLEIAHLATIGCELLYYVPAYIAIYGKKLTDHQWDSWYSLLIKHHTVKFLLEDMRVKYIHSDVYYF